MSKKDKGGPAASNKAITVANQAALKGFPITKLTAAFDRMGGHHEAATASKVSQSDSALAVVRLGLGWRKLNAEAHLETVVTGWRDEFKTVAMRLAVEGNKYAEIVEGKVGKERCRMARRALGIAVEQRHTPRLLGR